MATHKLIFETESALIDAKTMMYRLIEAAQFEKAYNDGKVHTNNAWAYNAVRTNVMLLQKACQTFLDGLPDGKMLEEGKSPYANVE